MSRFNMEIDILEGRDSERLDSAWDRVESQFEALQDLSRRDNFPVGIVVLPPREQVIGLYPHARYQSRVRTLAEPLGFFVIDPLPALAAVKDHKDRLYVAYDRNHPSASGHAVIAHAIVDALRKNGRLNPQARLAREEGTP
jgi:lysophospholipase L1-like esterase